jgi:tyrosyl-tRNA synthetase
MDEKKRIAEDLVGLYHGRDAARAARDYFERTIQRREVPSEVSRVYEWSGEPTLLDVVVAIYPVSKREAKGLIGQGGIRLDGASVTDPHLPWPTDADHVVDRARKNHVLVRVPRK